MRITNQMYRVFWMLGAGVLCMGAGPCVQPTGLLQQSTEGNVQVPSDGSIYSSDQKYLYVASGTCNSGGVATNTGTGVISRYSLTTGERVNTVFAYDTPLDMPVGLVEHSPIQIMTMIENATGGRRIDVIYKNGMGLVPYLNNSTILSAALKGLEKSADLGILISKTSAIEKLSASRVRVTIGATNPYINNPATNGAAVCTGSNTAATFVKELPGGNVIFGHAAATPNNKLVMISSNGYNATTDCLATRSAPTTTALPTNAVLHSSGKLLVTYGSTTYGSNSVYAYDVNETTPSISAGTQIIPPSVVNGPSAITADPDTGDIYVANATANAESIEKYTFNSGTGTFTRVGVTPFIPKSEYLRCVSGLLIAY